MMERGNGLGAGYAAYGIYPEHAERWCFHVMYRDDRARGLTEEYLRRHLVVEHQEPMPTRRVRTLRFVPLLWRYFVSVREELTELEAEQRIIDCVMEINRHVEGAFVFSSGRNMGIFKGVGDPDQIAEFYRIPDYRGYIWTAHNRFPTNSVGWWGGAHPFGILDWSVVHNGEISSYGINRRYLETFGYWCCLSTDTEVMAYLFDLLVRRHGLELELVARVLASPFWSQIEREEDPRRQALLRAIRVIYGSALVNGPFAVVVANSACMLGLNDRIKLRPLVAATKGHRLYISSEEAAIRTICPQPDRVWMPKAGDPTVGRLSHGQA